MGRKMRQKATLVLVLAFLLFAPSACGGVEGDDSLSHDATSTDPVLVSPESAINKANQARDIENQAREQREKQMQEESTGTDF
jgi:hypothetical protein